MKFIWILLLENIYAEIDFSFGKISPFTFPKLDFDEPKNIFTMPKSWQKPATSTKTSSTSTTSTTSTTTTSTTSTTSTSTTTTSTSTTPASTAIKNPTGNETQMSDWEYEFHQMFYLAPIERFMRWVIEQTQDPQQAKTVYQDVLKGRYNGYSLFNEPEIDSNMEWLFNVRNDSARMNYLRQISNIENVVHLTPDVMASIVDYSDHCWAIVLLDSNFTSDVAFEYVEQIIKSVSKTFYEKCGVGFVEMTYPSNFKIFYESNIKTVPTILLKNPESKMITVEPNDNQTHWEFDLRPIHEWGIMFDAREIYEYFDQILAYGLEKFYDPMTSMQKLKMIYSRIYTDEEKSMMKYIIDSYEDGINTEVKYRVMEDLKEERYSTKEMNKNSKRIRDDLMATRPIEDFILQSVNWLEANQNSSFISRLEPLEPNTIYLK